MLGELLTGPLRRRGLVAVGLSPSGAPWVQNLNWAQWECLTSVPPGRGPCWRWLWALGGAGIGAGSLVHTSGSFSSRLRPLHVVALTLVSSSWCLREPGGGWGSQSPASEPARCPSTLDSPGPSGPPPTPEGRGVRCRPWIRHQQASKERAQSSILCFGSKRCSLCFSCRKVPWLPPPPAA